MDKKRKPYQHDDEVIELLLRFLDRKQKAVHREYWDECSSATPTQSVGVREDKKENKPFNLIRLSSNNYFLQTYKEA